jgi:hypothetical protein
MSGVQILTSNQGDKLSIIKQASIPNAAGGGAGASVSTNLTYADRFGNGLLPPSYVVLVTASQPATASVINRTSTGFTVVLTPVSGTLAAGTFEVLVVG